MTPEQEPTPEREPTSEPRIWVASLSDYTAGHLHGEWIDANREPVEIWEDINQMLAASQEPGAEEIGIFDYDNFEGIAISEWEPIETIARLAHGVVNHGRPFAAWVNSLDRAEWEERLADFEDHYAGTWESVEAYALDYLDACGIDPDELPVPEHLQPYVRLDVEALGRDLTADQEVVVEPDGTVFLFDP
jgi:antirestriction protein